MLTKHQESLQNELNFTENLISDNLSNYSSWHHRSCLFMKEYCLLDGDDAKQAKLLMNEIDLVNNAIFTDSSDSSVWLYFSWLFSNSFYSIWWV